MVQSAANLRRFSRNSWLTWTLCGIVCLAALINLILVIRGRPAADNLIKLTNDVAWSIVPIVFAVLAALITSRQPRNRIGWLLLTPAIIMVVTMPIDAYLGQFTSAPPPTIPILLMLWFQNWAWILLIFPLCLILLLFPTGSPPSPRWRWILGYTLGKIVYFIFLVTFVQNFSEINDAWKLPNPIGFIPNEPEVLAFLVTPWLVSLGVLVIACAASLFVRYRRASLVERLQIKWLLFAAGLFVLFYVPLILIPFDAQGVVSDMENFLLIFFIALFPLAIAVAILRYRLFDIDIIINRALVYGTLTALVIGLYVFVVGYLGAIFRTESNLFISLAATGVVAVLFQPLWAWLQRGVNRLMYGQRDEPVAVLSQLGARLETTLTPEAILPGLVETVTQALKLPYAAIALQVGDQLKVQAEHGHPSAPLETFPLVYQGQPIGQLWVAPRAPGEAFNPADRLVLTNIARQAGAVAHAVQITAALQQSRQQLVTAREEERRRLRRDLHDGLGPQLASQTLTLNAIAKLLERDSAKARELLAHLQAQSQAAIEDIRRLVYALRPPALDELGLVAALREGVRQYGQIEITTDPQPLPTLPAAVEVAVYRIAQEAITNVIRHTQAKKCIVSITAQGYHLDLTIADDGPGFPPEFHFGVGLNSMRERAEELGGHLHFENQLAGGAQVQVWLPLPGEEA